MPTTGEDDGTDATGTDAPNVLVIICDDLGYGDLSCHGNTVVQTPAIDDLHGESTRFTRFYGGPVCSPSRASLMTGRYHHRTGITDTWKGRSMMFGDEVTLAEQLGRAGYATGLFGKWHLGDNAPMRPEDQGFDETLYHRGGGLEQPGNLPEGGGYVDPVLTQNGDRVAQEGYCTDIFGQATAEFIEDAAGDGSPFFAMLATNAPHVPLHVPDDAAQPYRERGCNDRRARIYGMISNIDENVARVLDTLERTGQADDTIVVFTSDHGPQPVCPDQHGDGTILRYNRGLRGSKNGVYEGGIRVPCFVRWPGGDIPGGVDAPALGHFVDLFPTLLEAADAPIPSDRTIDGESRLPLLRGDPESADDPTGERHVFLQWHRGDRDELHRHTAVVGQRWKLVNGTELYDLQADPGEQRNLAATRPERVRALREAYEAWYADVTGDREGMPRIDVGSAAEDPTLLTRQDWRGTTGGWTESTDQGHWEVTCSESASFDIEVRFDPLGDEGEVHFFSESVHRQARATPEADCVTFEGVTIGAGTGTIRAWATDGETRHGARYVDLAFRE
jgi:arylsulfatase A-like enzyme